MLWLNTALLAASSAAVEAATAWGSRRSWNLATLAMTVAVALGVAFLGGQAVAWRQLVAMGAYRPSTPHSSFFFMLTGAHAVHVVAALVVLSWGLASTRAAWANPRAWAARMDLCRTFWHYLGVVWVFLFALVSLY